MIIGLPKEIKPQENRVALVPGGALQLVKTGNTVLVQKTAGDGSGFTDEMYVAAGAELVDTADEVWERAEMIVKVKEPYQEELTKMRDGQILFTYLHFAASKELTDAVIESKCIAIAYETVEDKNGGLPLLVPMSEVAGRMAAQQGAKYLEKTFGGRGKLLGGVPGVPPADVLILGGGIVGVNAAKMTAGLGANTTIMDVNMERLRYLSDVMPANVSLVYSSEMNIRQMLPNVDLIIGGVLKPGAKAPHLITREMLKELYPGTVLVDVAIDQGGCFETARPTTHSDPIYFVDGILHYCVANMPGAVPYTSTLALTNVTLTFILQIANKGWVKALADHAGLAKGLNIANGKIHYQDVADAFGY
jgi:alanine dehydrogenase